jgi:uncharacterized protein
MLPRMIRNWQMSADSVFYAGIVPELQLPELKEKNEDFQAGGMSGPVKIKVGMEGFGLEFNLAEHNPAVKKLFGKNGVIYRFKAAEVADDSDKVDAFEVVMIGRMSEIKPSGTKMQDKTELKVSVVLTAYSELENGVAYIDIDFLNMKEVIGGVDRLAAQRAAIGMLN